MVVHAPTPTPATRPNSGPMRRTTWTSCARMSCPCACGTTTTKPNLRTTCAVRRAGTPLLRYGWVWVRVLPCCRRLTVCFRALSQLFSFVFAFFGVASKVHDQNFEELSSNENLFMVLQVTCSCPNLAHTLALSGNLTKPQFSAVYTPEPTPLPTAQPTHPPSHEPTSQPTQRPTPAPSLLPSLSSEPTGSTNQPTSIRPSQEPTMTPTLNRDNTIRIFVSMRVTAIRDFVARYVCALLGLYACSTSTAPSQNAQLAYLIPF